MNRHYRDLAAWQEAMTLVTDVYEVTRSFPREEMYGLSNQVRRAAVSIPSNIAEGQGRGSTKEFHHQLVIARGSLAEVETQLIIASRLGYVDRESLTPIWLQARTVGKLLNGLIRSLDR